MGNSLRRARGLSLSLSLSLARKPATADVGTYVMRQGDKGEEMFILVKGKMGVFDPRNSGAALVMTLHSGATFGELAALGISAIRTATVQALKFCELYILSRERLQVNFSDKPEVVQAMREKVESTLDMAKILKEEKLNSNLMVMRGVKKVARKWKGVKKIPKPMYDDDTLGNSGGGGGKSGVRELLDPMTSLQNEVSLLKSRQNETRRLFDLIAERLNIGTDAKSVEPPTLQRLPSKGVDARAPQRLPSKGVDPGVAGMTGACPSSAHHKAAAANRDPAEPKSPGGGSG